ncbi:CocE/NonD family hydrolase [Sphingomonas rosea]|uniref:CocE/NonD family hydrolase n=1 Tax=Sphingomonas rosea TaxID=335605 RepID=A0ABP7TKB5_9SPHN
MTNLGRRLVSGCAAVAVLAATPLGAQSIKAPEGNVVARALEHQAVPMRDGVKLDTSVYLPKGQGPFPAIVVRSPYPIGNPEEPGAMDQFARRLLDRGYALVLQNERGMYMSEGKHIYMANAGPDGVDTLNWVTKQPWSSGRIGTYGCSSTAEDQLALMALNHPAHQAAVVLGYGAGIGKIGPYAEQGNIYRGGALQLLFASWMRDYIGSSGPGADERPMFPSTLSPEAKTRLSKLYSLKLNAYATTPKISTADMLKFYGHLPVSDLISADGGPRTDWEWFSRWNPADPGWNKISFANEGDTFGVPALWGVSWYDVSVGPNLYLYDYARKHIAKGRPADQQYLVVSPGVHCSFQRQPAKGPVGERDIGDPSYDFDKRIIDFFDWKLKGIANGAEAEPRVQTYQMGENAWLKGDRSMTLPPRTVQFYLSSSAGANSVNGDGMLVPAPAMGGREADSFVYDPKRPVQTLGGGACCMGGIPAAGAYDQAQVEARQDVLVYSTPPLTQAVRVRGPVTLELYVSSDAPDTDIAVKLADVYPDGRSYNLDDSIFRVRYRDGYDKPRMLEKGKVVKVTLPPMFTGNTFLPGHRIRLQVTSSNFPRYERNLNTGGRNGEETVSRVANNSVHHSRVYPSRITLGTD